MVFAMQPAHIEAIKEAAILCFDTHAGLLQPTLRKLQHMGYVYSQPNEYGVTLYSCATTDIRKQWGCLLPHEFLAEDC